MDNLDNFKTNFDSVDKMTVIMHYHFETCNDSHLEGWHNQLTEEKQYKSLPQTAERCLQEEAGCHWSDATHETVLKCKSWHFGSSHSETNSWTMGFLPLPCACAFACIYISPPHKEKTLYETLSKHNIQQNPHHGDNCCVKYYKNVIWGFQTFLVGLTMQLWLLSTMWLYFQTSSLLCVDKKG